jgi:hypothetical protein
MQAFCTLMLTAEAVPGWTAVAHAINAPASAMLAASREAPLVVVMAGSIAWLTTFE